MCIRYGMTMAVLIAAAAQMFSVNAYAAKCNQQTVFSDICVANKVLECTKRYSPKPGSFTYSWEYLTYASATLKTSSPLLGTTLGYTPVSCNGELKFSASMLPKPLVFMARR